MVYNFLLLKTTKLFYYVKEGIQTKLFPINLLITMRFPRKDDFTPSVKQLVFVDKRKK
jgi:hypothetical protein